VRLLVTGAGGMLGQDVVRAAAAPEGGHDVVALDRSALDVTDQPAVLAALRGERPDVVVNCAAFTDVDGAESAEAAASAVNAAAAGHVSEAAARVGARIVHVSTDYVFDGAAGQPYVESDEPGPLGAYGRTKLAGEREVAARNRDHAIVRSSWLFGAGGRNFVQTMLALGAERSEVTVVDDQVGCPTWTGHLGPALVRLAEGDATGVLHVAGGGSCSWHELAEEVMRHAGLECAVHRGRTADLGRPAPRPALSALRSARADAPVLPPWHEGLHGYLTERSGVAA